jgi:3-methylcrotonyl-CoA carboxylase beta subunit
VAADAAADIRCPVLTLRFASARLWDDGVIDPADTRRVVGLALGAAMHGFRAAGGTAGAGAGGKFGVFRM